MKRVVCSIIFYLVITCTLAFAARAQQEALEQLPTVIESDLNADGRAERIRLDDKSDPALSIRRGRRILWRGVHARWLPWKLLIADVDGDGQREIIVGVRKSTRYFPSRITASSFIHGTGGAHIPSGSARL